MNTQDQSATFAELLQAAISEPGKIHTAYFAFHGFSFPSTSCGTTHVMSSCPR